MLIGFHVQQPMTSVFLESLLSMSIYQGQQGPGLAEAPYSLGREQEKGSTT